ncbi:MAG: hypothetical protein ACE5DX_06175 [Candidatus Dojkabacteria bacterium]
MTQRYHNPFAGVDLIVPVEQHDLYDRYCQSGGRAIIDRSPFPRMVDFWFTGLALAARKQLKPIDLSNNKTVKIIDGAIFDRDSWRVQTVMLIAIATENSVEVVGEPRRMMSIANGLAAAGIPVVEDMLLDGDQDPIWNLSESLDGFLHRKAE